MAKRSATARLNVKVDNGFTKPEAGESRIQEPTVTEWDPMEGTGETPPEDRSTPSIDDPNLGRSTPTPPKDEAEKQERIRKLLSNDQEEEKPAETAAKPEPAKEETKPASRRDILANLGAEKAKRSLEAQLKEERDKRVKAEQDAAAARKLMSEADIREVAKARGMTTDQVIDMLLNPEAEATKPAQAAPQVDQQTNERLSRLEQRERELLQREALSRMDEETKELDIPVTRATNRVAVAQADGSTRIMSGRELVLATAQRLWEADGKPAGKQREYIKEAAPLVEEQLVADDKERFEAYAKKVGVKPAEGKPPTKKPAVPSVGSRSGGATARQEEPPPLPDDPDERRLAIKQRLGWSS